ncbi:MAG: AbgT family transporter [Escherichia sp.]
MFIASGSAIWSILAPFVPMFMLFGFRSAFKILFRIADSSVLPLAPVSPLFHCFLILQRYNQTLNLVLTFC